MYTSAINMQWTVALHNIVVYDHAHGKHLLNIMQVNT